MHSKGHNKKRTIKSRTASYLLLSYHVSHIIYLAFIGRWHTLITSLSSSMSADLQFNISHTCYATNPSPLCNIGGPSSSNLSSLQLFPTHHASRHVLLFVEKKRAQLTTMQSSFVFSALYSRPCFSLFLKFSALYSRPCMDSVNT